MNGSQSKPVGLFLFLISLMFSVNCVLAQKTVTTADYDTIRITPENIIVFRDSILIPETDTIILVKKNTKYKVRKNPYKKSDAFYDSLYYKSGDYFLTREVYRLLLTHKPQEDIMESATHIEATGPFKAYEGKTIDTIRFIQVDILEGSVDDTLRFAVTGVGRSLNKSHINTREWILRNYMLVKAGDEVEPGIISDNERVIRDLPGIEDARFVVVPDQDNADKVQLIVVTQDVFPVGIIANVSSLSRFDLGLSNPNTLGLNFELGGTVYYDSRYSRFIGYELNAGYRNIFGSFIEGDISYINAFDTRGFRLLFKKEFLTPQTKYGGELSTGWMKDKYSIGVEDTLVEWMYERNYQDIWLGRSFQLGGKSSRKNLIFSGRVYREKFVERPYVSRDSNVVFHNSNTYFGKITFSKLSYYKSNLIRSFETTEDIPYGIVGGFTFGYLDSEYFGRTYFGVNLGAAKYYPEIGYLSGNIIVGSFFDDGKASQGLIEASLTYYTPLLKMNRYSNRNFIYLRYRGAITDDVDTDLNFGESIRELDQKRISGLSSLTMKYEFVLFTPWYFYGFRFAPFFFADVGLISSSKNVFYKSEFYSATGIGIRIGNKSLAFESIVLSIGFLTHQPSDQSAMFYEFFIGDSDSFELIDIEKPHVLRREVIFPY